MKNKNCVSKTLLQVLFEIFFVVPIFLITLACADYELDVHT